MIGRANRKACESVFDLLIGELPEIGIEESDGAEKLVVFKAYHVVSLLAQGDERIGRRDRYRKHELARPTHAGSAEGCPGGGAGGDAVVYDDGDTPCHIDGGTIAEIEPAAALDFGELVIANGCEFSFVDARHPNHLVIANDDRKAPVDHCSHGQLGLGRNPDLADQDQVKGGVERGCDLCGYRDTTAQQGEDHGLLIPVRQKRLRKLAAGIGSIHEGHIALSARPC